MMDWLEYGSHVVDEVESRIKEFSSEIESGRPLSTVVASIPVTLPEPEKIHASEFSFLAYEDNPLLMSQILYLERWGLSLLRLSREYSRLREDWEVWAFENSNQAKLAGGKALTSTFSGQTGIIAQAKHERMTAMLEGIIEAGKQRDDHEMAIAAFNAECRNLFPNAFPRFEISYRGANAAYMAEAMKADTAGGAVT